MTNFPMVLAVWFARVSLRKPPTRAITLILPPHCAQTGDGFWGKSNEKPFIMATAHKKAAITPKPATFDLLGKIPAKPVYLGDHAFSDGDPAKAGDWLGENRMGTRLSWRLSQEKAAVTPKPATFERFGEISSGSRLFWRSRNQARSDWQGGGTRLLRAVNERSDSVDRSVNRSTPREGWIRGKPATRERRRWCVRYRPSYERPKRTWLRTGCTAGRRLGPSFPRRSGRSAWCRCVWRIRNR